MREEGEEKEGGGGGGERRRRNEEEKGGGERRSFENAGTEKISSALNLTLRNLSLFH